MDRLMIDTRLDSQGRHIQQASGSAGQGLGDAFGEEEVLGPG